LEKIRPNCLEKNGMSPLVQACFKGNEEMVKMLLEIGADADIRYHDQGYTPLMFAALAGLDNKIFFKFFDFPIMYCLQFSVFI